MASGPFLPSILFTAQLQDDPRKRRRNDYLGSEGLDHKFRLVRDRLCNSDHIRKDQEDAEHNYRRIPFHTIPFNPDGVKSL